jgi:hypothetical protein
MSHLYGLCVSLCALCVLLLRAPASASPRGDLPATALTSAINGRPFTARPRKPLFSRPASGFPRGAGQIRPRRCRKMPAARVRPVAYTMEQTVYTMEQTVYTME